MSRTLGYFPTIDDKPARFDGWQVCYCNRGFPVVLTPTLRQVRVQIQKSIANRRACGLDTDGYGVQRVAALKGERP